MFKITIDRDLCAMCGTCVLSCPETVFVQKEKSSTPDIIHEDLCISCGHCVAIWPREAITHRDFPQGSVDQIMSDFGRIVDEYKRGKDTILFSAPCVLFFMQIRVSISQTWIRVWPSRMRCCCAIHLAWVAFMQAMSSQHANVTTVFTIYYRFLTNIRSMARLQ